MIEKEKAIIVDLDGTYCNTDHRQHLVEAKNWDGFYEALVNDKPNKWCEDLVFALEHEGDFKIIFVSGRPEKYRELTLQWFESLWGYERTDLKEGFDFITLFMRKDGDFRKDSIIKEEIYREHIEPKYDIHFCIDDRKQVVDMWRSIGLVCLQCAEGNF
jgi:hypothetical protein